MAVETSLGLQKTTLPSSAELVNTASAPPKLAPKGRSAHTWLWCAESSAPVEDSFWPVLVWAVHIARVAATPPALAAPPALFAASLPASAQPWPVLAKRSGSNEWPAPG